MIQAVLFDFDGTLADSFDAIISSVHFVRQSFGLPTLAGSEVRKLVGHGLTQLMQDACPGCPVDEAVRRYREHHKRVMITGTKLMPGVRETLEELHRRGLKLGVCSNKAVSFTRELIVTLGLSDLLPEVLGPEDVEDKPKPHPAMLIEALRRFGVSPEHAVYIGDMTVDVLAGKAAGMPVWLVHVGLAGVDDPREAGPDLVLGHFSEILTSL